jgi:beta-lactamase superfamily II metal-dependent hydrolase
MVQSPAALQDHSQLTFVDVGQGDCLHIRTSDGKNYLVDGGGSADYNIGKKTVLPYLLKNGVRHLDGVFVSHLHTDHFKGITELACEMDIGAVYTYAGNILRTEELTDKVWSVGAESGMTGITEGDLRFVGAGDVVNLGRGATADILFPPKGTTEDYTKTVIENEDENKTSLLVRFNIGKLSVLMTGDIGFDGEKEILALLSPSENAKNSETLETAILKMGHHGSKTSTSDEFLSAVSPKVAVIQVGTNNYGHPTAEVLDKLSEAGIITYRNDNDGAIMMDESSADKIRVRTQKTSFVSDALAGKYY